MRSYALARDEDGADSLSATRSLAGAVERVTFHNPETGFCVLRVALPDAKEPATIVGQAPAVNPGEMVEATGAWVNDPSYGIQFRAETLQITAPTSPAGLERYLASGLIHGIGPVCARRLVDAFGEGVLDVIAREPAALRRVEGVGPWRAQRIVAAFAEQQAIREIVLFLHGHGLPAARAVRIYKTYGPAAVSAITADPYRLARDVRGIGFHQADRIAAALGIAASAPTRIRAGLVHTLVEALEDGHCGLPVDEAIARAEALLGVSGAPVADALAVERLAPDLVSDDIDDRPFLFLAGLHAQERAIASRLSDLALGVPPWGRAEPTADIAWAEARTGLAFGPSQREALRHALASREVVNTGGPGVGKTTLLDALLALLVDKGMNVALCAPTGRAAKRLSESTGLQASTIHRLLEIDALGGGFRRGPTHPLACDVLVVDEMSMVDIRLMHALLRALPEGAALVLVGDVDQLPSIGPGQVLADIIASGAVPVARLREVFRQGEGSRIVASAHAVNRGEAPDLARVPDSDFHFVPADDPEDGLRKVLALVTQRIPARFGLDPVADIQVLAPMNRGGLGVRALNLALQRALNPPGESAIERFGWTFGPGDKVMQIVNDHERDVFNGDIGVVTTLDHDTGALTVAFEGREVPYAFGELDELVLAYATTIHKAQGSEYPAVVIPLSMQHAPMLRRDLLYTALTRAKRLVVLVGSHEALALAVGRGRGGGRWSRLRGWLRDLLPSPEGERGRHADPAMSFRGSPQG